MEKVTEDGVREDKWEKEEGEEEEDWKGKNKCIRVEWKEIKGIKIEWKEKAEDMTGDKEDKWEKESIEEIEKEILEEESIGIWKELIKRKNIIRDEVGNGEVDNGVVEEIVDFFAKLIEYFETTDYHFTFVQLHNSSYYPYECTY